MEHTTPMRVLLVEDEIDVRGFFARALAHMWPALEVVTAANGCEALDLLRGGQFDLVLSDQRMPKMTGLELLTAVRAWSQVPFLLISADRSVEVAAYAAGANAFLSKPIGLDGLRAAVARYLFC
jgi:two-component system KDP operon response regulator KdpE